MVFISKWFAGNSPATILLYRIFTIAENNRAVYIVCESNPYFMKKVFNIFKVVQTVVDLIGTVLSSLKKKTDTNGKCEGDQVENSSYENPKG